jgi:hypothetical protein
MTIRTRRRLNLFGAVIVIAAAATPLGIYRWLYPPAETWPFWNMTIASHEDRVKFTSTLIYLAWPFLLCATLAFAAIRLIGPRPRLGRLLRHPGSVGCFTALAFIAVSVLISRVIADVVYLRPPTLPPVLTEEDRADLVMSICRGGTGAGYAVASSWLMLALGRGWRRGMGWIEALGLLLGAAWIVWSVSYTICPHL